MAIVTLMAYRGDITGPELTEALKWMLGIGVAGHALKGGAEAIGRGLNGDK
jgi:hypothetical protein